MNIKNKDLQAAKTADAAIKDRYHLIDAVRGIAIISMIIYHFCFDLFVLFGRRASWPEIPLVYIWQQSICITFIFISGAVWSFGRRGNLKRGIFLNICGLVITGVTFLFTPSAAVIFGVLNFIGCAILIMIPLDKALKKVNPYVGLVFSLILFILLKHIPNHYIGIGETPFIIIPREIYNIGVFTVFGFPHPGFSSGDFFPIFPWLFLFCAGYFFNMIIPRIGPLDKLLRLRPPILPWIGRKSIWIYMLHQPVCYAVCILLQALGVL